jgi:hypothetical protein
MQLALSLPPFSLFSSWTAGLWNNRTLQVYRKRGGLEMSVGQESQSFEFQGTGTGTGTEGIRDEDREEIVKKEGEEITHSPIDDLDLHDDPILLKYVDYICSEEMMKPILQQVQEMIGIPIVHLPVPSDRSGPKFDQIHEIFSENYANIGRI